METNPRILLIRLKSIGDVVLTLPAVNTVRDNFPSAKITFLTSKENAPLLGSFREVNEVIALDRAALRSGNPLKMAREFFNLFRRLRAGKFSHVVDFQGYGETAWLAWFTGAPQRWGSVYRKGRAWAYTRGVTRKETGVSQIADRNLAMLKLSGLSVGNIRNEFWLPPDALAAAKKFYADQELVFSRPTLFIQAFTSSLHKNWPLENYLRLAEHFRACGAQIIFAGGSGEVKALQPAVDGGFAVAVGVPLPTVAAIMKLSTVVIGGVTGLLHIAVALPKRVVMLVGWPDRESGFPYQHKDWAVVPSDGAGTRKIKLASVIAACERAFNESTGNASC